MYCWQSYGWNAKYEVVAQTTNLADCYLTPICHEDCFHFQWKNLTIYHPVATPWKANHANILTQVPLNLTFSLCTRPLCLSICLSFSLKVFFFRAGEILRLSLKLKLNNIFFYSNSHYNLKEFNLNVVFF